jgi:hypothetical protein
LRNKDWEHWCLLSSDRHWDNPHSDRVMQIRHLEEAKEKGASIIDAGDFFCLMQGKYDKRAAKSCLRPEHQGDNYFSLVIEDAVAWLKPYARQFVTIATGNHEAAVQKMHEFNFVDMFCGAVNQAAGSNVSNGGYAGYVAFKFLEPASRDRKVASRNIVLHYEHGAGGDSPVTGDMIGHFRQGVYFPDADIMLSGHNHNQWSREIARQRFDKHTGALKQDIQTHIKSPTYKDEFGDGSRGWHCERRGPPKPIGAWWLRFYWHAATTSVRYDVIHAR